MVNNSQAEPSADRHGSINVLVCAGRAVSDVEDDGVVSNDGNSF